MSNNNIFVSYYNSSTSFESNRVYQGEVRPYDAQPLNEMKSTAVALHGQSRILELGLSTTTF
jgi:hypothetical protein